MTLRLTDVTQRGDQFFGKSVRKIFVLGVAAFVEERQDRDRFLRNR